MRSLITGWKRVLVPIVVLLLAADIVLAVARPGGLGDDTKQVAQATTTTSVEPTSTSSTTATTTVSTTSTTAPATSTPTTVSSGGSGVGAGGSGSASGRPLASTGPPADVALVGAALFAAAIAARRAANSR